VNADVNTDVNTDEESRAVAKVVDRLAERFPNLPRASVERAVREAHDAFSGRPVRVYVPVLVERGAKLRLRDEQAAASGSASPSSATAGSATAGSATAGSAA